MKGREAREEEEEEEGRGGRDGGEGGSGVGGQSSDRDSGALDEHEEATEGDVGEVGGGGRWEAIRTRTITMSEEGVLFLWRDVGAWLHGSLLGRSAVENWRSHSPALAPVTEPFVVGGMHEEPVILLLAGHGVR